MTQETERRSGSGRRADDGAVALLLEVRGVAEKLRSENERLARWLGYVRVCIDELGRTDAETVWEALLRLLLDEQALASSGSAFLNYPNEQVVRGAVRMTEGTRVPFKTVRDFRHGEGLAGACAHLGAILVHPGNGSRYFMPYAGEQITAIACAPVHHPSDHSVLAVVCVHSRIEGVTFDEQAQAFLDLVCRLAAASLAYYELAHIDPRTGLKNELAFLVEGDRITARASAESPVGLLLLDVDNLHGLNEEFTHEIVDVAFQQLGGLLDRLSRTQGVRVDVYRCHGAGDEFAAVVHGNRAKCLEVAEAIRAATSGTSLGTIPPGRLTFSIGATTVRAGEPVAELRSRAQTYAQLAKRSGRNRVEAEGPVL